MVPACRTDSMLRNGLTGFSQIQMSGSGIEQDGKLAARSARISASCAVSPLAAAPRRHGHSASYCKAIARYRSESVLTMMRSIASLRANAIEYAIRG